MKVSDRARRILRRAAVLLITVAVILVGLSWVERERNKEEEYAVYSAYLSEGLLNDAHDLSTGGPVQVVIRDTTLPPGNLRFRLFYLFDGRARFGELHTLTLASYLARNLFHAHPREIRATQASNGLLHARLRVFFARIQRKFPRNMGLVALSGVGFNPSRSQAVFYIDHFCGLCGVVDTYSWRRSAAFGVCGMSTTPGFRETNRGVLVKLI